jgi:hypothetical protein
MKRVILMCAALAFAFWQLTSCEIEAVRYALVLYPVGAAALI